MVLVIIWGVADVLYVLYQRLMIRRHSCCSAATALRLGVTALASDVSQLDPIAPEMNDNNIAVEVGQGTPLLAWISPSGWLSLMHDRPRVISTSTTANQPSHSVLGVGLPDRAHFGSPRRLAPGRGRAVLMVLVGATLTHLWARYLARGEVISTRTSVQLGTTGSIRTRKPSGLPWIRQSYWPRECNSWSMGEGGKRVKWRSLSH